jgi:DNA-binding transcriptional LysR family regulator
LRRAVAAGIGLGLLPVADFLGTMQDLVRVLPAYGVRGGVVHVVWPSSRYLPARVAAFREFLVEELTKSISLAHTARQVPPAGERRGAR